jgi:threonine dehydratase
MDLPVLLDDILAAQARIAPFINCTPLLPSAFFSARASVAASASVASASADAPSIELLLKAECMQKTGSFKIRGATNAVRSMIESGEVVALPDGAGVVTHSSGNHGQALAAAAAASNVKCVVVVPEGSPAVKANAARDYGAEVVYCAPNLASRERVCAQLQAVTGAVFVPPYNHKLIIAGQGTLGVDIMQQASAVDVIVVPVSGGGLISGVAIAVKGVAPSTIVVGAEPTGANDCALSKASGQLTRLDSTDTICDGLRSAAGSLFRCAAPRKRSPASHIFCIRCNVVGALCWPVICSLVDAVAHVPDFCIAETVAPLLICGSAHTLKLVLHRAG